MKPNNFQASNCFEHNILSFLVTSANERVKKNNPQPTFLNVICNKRRYNHIFILMKALNKTSDILLSS